jgi:small subunit ribosomal protein S17
VNEVAKSEATAEPEAGRSGPRKLIGRVMSSKMDKTIVVEVVRFKVHPVYKKYVRVRKRYKAHDEKNEYKTGDRVEIEEHRPLSREKRWKVVKLIERPAQELTGAVETP